MLASRSTPWLLTGAFLLIIACEGLIQGAAELRRGEAIQALDLVRQAPSEQHLRAFERELEERAWPAVMSRPAMQYVRHTLYDDLGEKALAGLDGWLFYRSDVDFLIEPWPLESDVAPLADDPLLAMVAFRDELAARGIQLLVVPVPGKPSVYPDRLSARDVHFPDGSNDHIQHVFRRLDEAGVPFVNLDQVYESARAVSDDRLYYLAQDTHWSPAGLALAAKTVADRILEEGWVIAGDVLYETRPARVNREGDLLRMIDSQAITATYPPEHVECLQVVDPSGAPYTDDPESPVLVLGDSFLRIFERDEPGSAGFIAHLAKELRQPVTSIVSDGGASTLVRQQLARNPGLLRNKKVVVWEFVERDLRFGMEGWQIVPLPLKPH